MISPTPYITPVAAIVVTGFGTAIVPRIIAVIAIFIVIGITVIGGSIAGAVIFITVAALAIVGLLVAIIAQHAVIMIGILQIIFRRHPVSSLLGITRQSPIFFQKLAGIAALPVIEPAAIIAAATHLLRARTTVAAAPPPVLVISDQRCVPV